MKQQRKEINELRVVEVNYINERMWINDLGELYKREDPMQTTIYIL